MTFNDERPLRMVASGAVVGDQWGAPDDRASLVLLHGLSFDRRMWGSVLLELAVLDPGRHVLSVDLPGHGESGDPSAWDLDEGVDLLHGLVAEQAMTEPVMVGHSAGALLATAYAGRHPTSGVVNVDASLEVEPFAQLLQSMERGLRGPGFDGIWADIARSFHTELLPPAERELVESYGPPRQDVALGFWGDLLALTPAQSTAAWAARLDNVAAFGGRYHLVTGSALEPAYEHWLRSRLPEATWEVMGAGSHFPQLDDPAAFAALLAGTAKWHLDTRSYAAAG